MEYHLMNDKLPEDVLALYKRYLAGENVRSLIDELGATDCHENQFYLLFSAVRINDLNCPVCSSPMLAKLPSKSSSASPIPHSCQNCTHTVMANIEGKNVRPMTDYFSKCHCSQCAAERKSAQEKLDKQQKEQALSFVEKIRKSYASQASLSSRDISEVGLTQLVGLHALVNTWATEDMTHLFPLRDKLESFWPTMEKSRRNVSDIYQKKLLQVDIEHSATTAFVEIEGEGINWYTLEASLIPSIRADSGHLMSIPDTLSYLEELIRKNLTNEQKAELPNLMRAIAVDECVQFYQYILGGHGFNYETGEKTEKIFEDMLAELPVNQICVCIWSAVKGAAAFLQTPGCSGLKHAFNSIQGRLRDAADRRISGEYKSDGFERNKYCPRSEISFSLYGLMGFCSDVGFESTLKNIPIPKEWDEVEEEAYSWNDDCRSFTREEMAALESRGFSIWHDVEASRKLAYTDQTIRIYKMYGASLYFQMDVRDGIGSNHENDEWQVARFATFDALIYYCTVFEKCNIAAESIGDGG